MKMTKVLTISALSVLLGACSSSQTQIEGAPAAVMTGMGPAHVHNVEGFGDFTHRHSGNSTAGHGHTWKEIQDEITKKGLR